VGDAHHEVQCAAYSNGKVERSHRIDDEEFWQRHSFSSFDDAAVALEAWERRYSHDRFSMALRGHTPSEVLAAKLADARPDPTASTRVRS
jgi:transposase InsO family protein